MVIAHFPTSAQRHNQQLLKTAEEKIIFLEMEVLAGDREIPMAITILDCMKF